MNNTILVGIDFSECSLNALSHAVSIAEKSNSNVVMVWVNKLANDRDIVAKDNDLIVFELKSYFLVLIFDFLFFVSTMNTDSIFIELTLFSFFDDFAAFLAALDMSSITI